MRIPWPATALVLAASAAWGHDIPNARVDRSIQVTVRPGRLSVDYQVGLSELTMTRDLRALVGALPGSDRRAWFDRYGRETGPLNAKGLLVEVDGRPLDLAAGEFDLAVEDHLIYTFHYEAPLPPRGRLSVRDTNYAAGEGTSRLAVRGVDGAAVRGDDLPGDVDQIVVLPAWQMADAEERRTSEVAVEFSTGGPAASGTAGPPPSPRAAPPRGPVAEGLSRLLDRSAASGLWLGLVALALGAAHAVQPGHGKSLVAAASLGESGGWRRGTGLALVVTAAHVGGVLAVAAGLWLTRSARYPDVNNVLARAAGFVIAAIGVWRLGLYLGHHDEHAEGPLPSRDELGARGLLGLGLAGGVVPCWDAVVLILLAEAVGRLALGIALLLAFSLGMAAVLVAVGVAAARLRGFVERRDAGGAWARRLGLLSASALTAIGLYLLAS